MVRSVGAGLCSARCSDEIGTRGRSRSPPLHGENPLPRSAGKGVLFGGYSFYTAEIIRLADWDTMKTNRFANKVIAYLLNCENEKLPTKTMLAFEP